MRLNVCLSWQQPGTITAAQIALTEGPQCAVILGQSGCLPGCPRFGSPTRGPFPGPGTRGVGQMALL